VSTEFITKNGSGLSGRILWWIMGIASVGLIGFCSSIHTRVTLSGAGHVGARGAFHAAGSGDGRGEGASGVVVAGD
jgi:hypothetical protein